VAGDDAVAGNQLPGHAEVEAPVRDELVDLLEGARIEQEVDALARRQLPGFALAAKPLFTAAEFRAPIEIGENVVHPMCH
jgi:hypothetical protein